MKFIADACALIYLVTSGYFILGVSARGPTMGLPAEILGHEVYFVCVGVAWCLAMPIVMCLSRVFSRERARWKKLAWALLLVASPPLGVPLFYFLDLRSAFLGSRRWLG